jgi:hypothetical protein
MRKFLSSLFVIIILISTSTACTRMVSKPVESDNYILYFRLWGDNNDEIGLMVITHKDFDGTLDDALLAMLG